MVDGGELSGNLGYYETFAAEYSHFFSDLHANMEEEGAWLDAILRREGVKSVLDASCGTGRQAIPLARRGYRVVAADPCSGMLRQAYQEMESAGVDVVFHRVAFRQLPDLDIRLDAVIAMGNGLCNQDRREDIVASLAAMRRCCLPGGPCLVGIKDFDRVRRERSRLHRHGIHRQEGERTILFEVWELADPLLISTAYSIRRIRGSRSIHSAATREYMLGAEELGAAAREAGFQFVQRLDHPSEAAYALH